MIAAETRPEDLPGNDLIGRWTKTSKPWDVIGDEHPAFDPDREAADLLTRAASKNPQWYYTWIRGLKVSDWRQAIRLCDMGT